MRLLLALPLLGLSIASSGCALIKDGSRNVVLCLAAPVVVEPAVEKAPAPRRAQLGAPQIVEPAEEEPFPGPPPLIAPPAEPEPPPGPPPQAAPPRLLEPIPGPEPEPAPQTLPDL